MSTGGGSQSTHGAGIYTSNHGLNANSNTTKIGPSSGLKNPNSNQHVIGHTQIQGGSSSSSIVNNQTASLVNLQPQQQHSYGGQSVTPLGGQSNMSFPHSKHVSSTSLPNSQQQNQSNTPSIKTNNPPMVGPNLGMNRASETTKHHLNQPGEISIKNNFTKAYQQAHSQSLASNNNHSGISLGALSSGGSNFVDFEVSSNSAISAKSIGQTKLSVGGGGNANQSSGTKKQSSFMKNSSSGNKQALHNSATDERRSTPAAQQIENESKKPIVGRGKETRSSMLVNSTNNLQQEVVQANQQQVPALLKKAFKFKNFFEQVNNMSILQGSGGGVLSTGGEYYFNDADKQSQSQLTENYSQQARSDFIIEEEDIKSVKCDLENQRVVRADAERTRGSEALDKDLIELILTKYCKNMNIKYKQGLNEIVAPFMYMMQEQNKTLPKNTNPDHSLKLDLKFVYNCFSAFVFRYLTNFFAEEEFYSLQTALAYLSLLHKYHDPLVAIHLINSQISPEMYAMPWFLTYFANKFELSILIDMWEMVIQEDDKMNLFYFSVALLVHNRENLLRSDPSHLPQELARITVQDKNILNEIWAKAKEIKKNTPQSFSELPDIRRIFSYQVNSGLTHGISLSDGNHIKSLGNEYDDCEEISNNSGDSATNQKEAMIAAIERIENLPCLPIMPEEVFFYAFTDMLNCPHPGCKLSLSNLKYQEFRSPETFNNNLPQVYSQTSGYSFTQITQGRAIRNDQTLIHQDKRRSQAIYDMQDALSPVRDTLQSQRQNNYMLDELGKREITQGAAIISHSTHGKQQRVSRPIEKVGQQSEKANLHAIIRRDIQQPRHQQQVTNNNLYHGNQHFLYQQQLLMYPNRIMSNQPSPTKGLGLAEQYEQMNKGIDLSSQRSPFKQMNKQLQAQADGMPLETESNVNDDAQEQQESHIDLINETTRMKHLAMNQELKNQMSQQQQYLLEQEGLQISSPKVHLNTLLQQSNRMMLGQIETQQLHFTPNVLNRNQLMNQANYIQQQHQQIYYKDGLQKSSNKHGEKNHNNSVSSNNSNSSSKRGSITPLQNQVDFKPLKMHPLTASMPHHPLELCRRCMKKQIYEELKEVKGAAESLNDTQTMEEDHDLCYQKGNFLIIDCRLDSIQKEAYLPISQKFPILSECTKDYLQRETERFMDYRDNFHICLIGLDPLSEKIENKFETNKNNENQNNNGEAGQLEIGAYHESILRFVIEEFQKRGFRYVSVVPGGFQEIHEICMKYRFQLVGHEGTCYHCDQEKESIKSKSEVYNQNFNLVGFGELFSGIKHLYDVAGTKIKNLVKGNNTNTVIQSKGAIHHNKSDLNVNRHGQSQMPQMQNPTQPQNHGPQTYRQQQKSLQHHTFDNQQTLFKNNQGINSLGIPAKFVQQTLQESQNSHNSSSDSLTQTVISSTQGHRQQVLSQSESRNNNGNPNPAQKGHLKTSENTQFQGKSSHIMVNSNMVSEQIMTQRREHQYASNQLGGPQMMNNFLTSTEKQQVKPDVPLGSLPMSFISQSSRQENQNRFQGSHCSSNASVNSSQNDGGNNLRDAISNKKIMSYKLMSKNPGDRSSEIISSHNPMLILSPQQQPFAISTQELQQNQDFDNLPQLQPQDQSELSQKSSLTLNYIRNDSGCGTNEIQNMASPLSTAHLVIQSQFSMNQNDIEKQDIKIMLSPQSEKILPPPSQPSNVQNTKPHFEERKVQNTQQQQQSDTKSKSSQKELANNEPTSGTQLQVIKQPVFTEEDLYYINGITKQVEITQSEFEGLMKKKGGNIIIYRAMKLHLKKKPDQTQSSSSVASSSTTPSIAYPVYLVITQYTVSVIREIGKRRSHLLGPVNQSIESSMSQAEEWDQNDFDELHPQLHKEGGASTKSERTPTKGGSQGSSIALIESRFMMYDLIKITSRKSSAKIITFYFRVPLMQEYNVQILEKSLLQQLDQKPPMKYQFAFKRKNYLEVSASFEFPQQEEAKECIDKVSTIYKKLKNAKQ